MIHMVAFLWFNCAFFHVGGRLDVFRHLKVFSVLFFMDLEWVENVRNCLTALSVIGSIVELGGSCLEKIGILGRSLYLLLQAKPSNQDVLHVHQS